MEKAWEITTTSLKQDIALTVSVIFNNIYVLGSDKIYDIKFIMLLKSVWN